MWLISEMKHLHAEGWTFIYMYLLILTAFYLPYSKDHIDMKYIISPLSVGR